MIFLLAGNIFGVVLAEPHNGVGLREWGWLVLLWLALLVIRAVVIAVFYPVLDVLGYGLHWKDALVLTWSGIRGCVRPPPCSDSFVANRTIRVWHDKKWAE